jgi:hypothetical protein
MSKVIYHLTNEHIFYLQSQTCYLTLKADGIYNKDIINEINQNCEYEQISNRKIIFNNLDDVDNIQNKIFNIAKLMNIEYPSIFKEELKSNNFHNIMNEYIKYYNEYDQDIIPKYYIKINKDEFVDILKILYNYYPETGFPNDGWVIVPENEKFIAKLKPTKHLTIDLKYKNNKFYANRWVEIIVSNNRKLKNNSVYRCYWENNRWISKEERYDKKYGNSIHIVEIITNHLMKGLQGHTGQQGLNTDLLEKFSTYYDNDLIEKKKYFSYFAYMKEYTIKWLKNNTNIINKCKLLDVGCGKSSNYRMLSDIGFKHIVGLDSDPICIMKSMIVSRTNNYIWMDINNNWNIKDQIKQFGEIWDLSQLYKLKHLYNKFDMILFNFSIFYCKQKNYHTLIKNLNNASTNRTKLLFNYIDYNNASDEIKKEFCINKNNEMVTLKLPWKNKEHEEPIFNSELFMQLLEDNNWKLVNTKKIESFYEDFIDWQKLFVYQVWEKY